MDFKCCFISVFIPVCIFIVVTYIHTQTHEWGLFTFLNNMPLLKKII